MLIIGGGASPEGLRCIGKLPDALKATPDLLTLFDRCGEMNGGVAYCGQGHGNVPDKSAVAEMASSAWHCGNTKLESFW